MSIYDIITVPDPVLKTKAEPVSKVDDALRAQMEKMLNTMYEAPGIGLAANQVNILNRVLVMDVAPDSWVYGPESGGVLTIESGYRSGKASEEEIERPRNPVVMANPEIIWASEQKSIFEEGCLSIPLQYGEVIRPASVRVKYLDFNGNPQEMEAQGLASHCVQHEIDHLNGILFIDYLSSLKRGMILRKVDKLKKQQAL
jgi:peptide deformylase